MLYFPQNIILSEIKISRGTEFMGPNLKPDYYLQMQHQSGKS